MPRTGSRARGARARATLRNCEWSPSCLVGSPNDSIAIATVPAREPAAHVDQEDDLAIADRQDAGQGRRGSRRAHPTSLFLIYSLGRLTPTFSCNASQPIRARSASFNSSVVCCNVR